MNLQLQKLLISCKLYSSINFVEVNVQAELSTVFKLIKMAELNDVDINRDSTKNLETTPTTEIELQVRQSSSSRMVSDTSGDPETVSKGDEGGNEAEDGEILPLNETNCSAGDQSEVESCIFKGRSSDSLK